MKITIIGYGRFGKTLHSLLKEDFDVTIYTRNKKVVILSEERAEGSPTQKVTSDLAKAYESDVIFYAVPIASFADVIEQHRKYFRPEHLLIDVLSVKMHPAAIFTKALQGITTQALLTHPMFGPDSSQKGFEGLPLVIDQFMADQENYHFWKNYFEKKQLHVIEMDPQTHDKLAADSQGLTHFIGRLLADYPLHPTPIDTLGTKKLLEVKEQTCNDTWELFTNLQHYNPYTKKMRIKLGEKYDKLFNKLLPEQKEKGILTIGIQGGEGSFNEQATDYYLNRNAITNAKIMYLYTAENVLRALHEGDIDQGVFAIHNSVGGIVMESIEALAQYNCAIIEQFAIKIAHALMIRTDATLKDITTIMTHPQVLSQCKQTLLEKYPHLKLTSGEGELIDHALVAKQLGEGKLAKDVAVMGSARLADLYGLTLIEDNLQDSNNNYTSFLIVKRI